MNITKKNNHSESEFFNSVSIENGTNSYPSAL